MFQRRKGYFDQTLPVGSALVVGQFAAYGFRGWSVAGKGIYVQELTSSGMVLYAGLDGHSQVLWKHGSSPGFWFDYPIPSPNGRYLAFLSSGCMTCLGFWDAFLLSLGTVIGG